MSIEKMELVNIVGRMKDLDQTLLKCMESGCFHIESSTKTLSGEQKQGFTKLTEQNPYTSLVKRIVSINFGETFDFKETKWSAKETDSDFLKYAEKYIDKTEKSFNDLNQKMLDSQQRINSLSNEETQIVHLTKMDTNMKELFSCKHIKIRFGRLPVDSYPKLEYYNDKTFIFVPYDSDQSYYWGVYFTLAECAPEIDDIFNSLYYERMRVPDFTENTPEEECQWVKNELGKERKHLEELTAERKKLLESQEQIINEIYCRLKFLHDNFELRQYVSVHNNNFYLVGFIPKRDAKHFTELFDKLDEVSVVIQPPDTDERLNIPVKLRNNKLTQPFSMFVEMYGLPSYNGINPTAFVAVTYTLLFGIMFGDLGQGIVLSLVGLIIAKKTGNMLGKIMERIGISSAFFGLIFGSCFGYEHALDPLYHAIGLKEKPFEVMDNTMTVLIGAICIGIVLILISIGLNIGVSFKKKNYAEAIFGNNGIAGIIFFVSLLGGLVSTLLGGANLLGNPLYIIGLIVLPLILMFLREPLGCLVAGKKFEMEGGVGDFIASNFFEVFEFLLGYATNTLSFVRIGGFVFSHAGMMSVVMLLAETVSAGASPIVVIIGNIFVMGMEGMIVGIQVLRLEFYEIFSRFYDGDGEAFEPVKVDYNATIE
mgnify:CR=1 FL=1